MQIWLGKQMLGQSDQQKIDHTVQVNYDGARQKVEGFLLEGEATEVIEDGSIVEDLLLDDQSDDGTQ